MRSTTNHSRAQTHSRMQAIWLCLFWEPDVPHERVCVCVDCVGCGGATSPHLDAVAVLGVWRPHSTPRVTHTNSYITLDARGRAFRVCQKNVCTIWRRAIRVGPKKHGSMHAQQIQIMVCGIMLHRVLSCVGSLIVTAYMLLIS